MHWWSIFLVLAFTWTGAQSARILSLVPMPAKSHAILFDNLVVELAKRGHEVVHVSTFKQKKPVPNLKEVILPDAMSMIQQETKMDMFEMRHMTPVHNVLILPQIGLTLCDAILKQEPIKELLNQKFDIVLGEGFLSESILGSFAQKTGGSIIALGTFMPNIWVNYLVGNPAPSAYVPEPFLGYGNVMSFKERVINFVFSLFGEAYHTLYYLEKQNDIYRKVVGEKTPHLTEILKNTSLVLVNHHYSLGFPRPYLPNMVEIGGIQISEPQKLPADLQKFMDESKEGVILFSLGSNLKSSLMPKEKIQTFMNAFSKLKMKVLWKFETDLPGKPENVMINKWLPQSDILAHPNLKLFITHGGLLSTTEAVHRGVPVVGIPIFGDQPLNMRHTEKSGFGKMLEFDSLTAESLVATVNEVLANPKYRQAAKQKSILLKDTPKTPLETAVYWVEYVARHKGAPHLKSAAQDLYWFQLHLLDVFAVLGLVLVVVLALEVCFVRFIFRKLCGKKSKKPETSAKKKKNN